MKKSLGICYILIVALLLSACGEPEYDGSRIGNDSQLVMKYKVFNTTDTQNLVLESGDLIRAEILVDSGSLCITIQKNDNEPIYESDGIVASKNFDVAIRESGTYTITITGEKAKGSVSFTKIAEKKNEKEETIDLSGVFQGINGCAVIYSPTQKHYTFFNEDMCKQEKSPYSTFKIISTLSGLQNGVITDESSKMNYDGTIYSNSDWNADLTLKEAFQDSCIWYFRQVIDSVGRDEIKKELNSLQYGNCDISEWDGSNINPTKELNGFWLGSSLEISPLEQVNVLKKIFEGQSRYDSNNIKILKNIMLVDESDTQKIYGKTGTGINGEAWFIGFSESDKGQKYFAIYLNDNKNRELISGDKAVEIALEILK